MSKEKPTARLHAVFASRKPRAVILRRGPSAWYHVILWNTAQDTFEHGAWFKGRLYEERCDLSPDGELFLYFALKGSLWTTSYEGSWTAVSRPPWLYALTLWPHGSTWGGGGRFSADREVVLRGSCGAHPDHPVRGLKVVDGECPPFAPAPAVPGAEWSGVDQGGYPVFTRQGKLFRRLARGDRELADFNGLAPKPVAAPAWAKTPLPTLSAEPTRKRQRRRRGGR